MLGNYAIAAQPIADTRGAPYVLPVTHGQYAVSMQGAAKLISDIYPSGTFAVNGQTVGLSAQRPANFNSGTFTYTGHDVTLDQGYGIVVPSGTFTLTGQDVVFDTGYGIVWNKGEFAVTGQSITYGISINAETGSFALTGQDALKHYTPLTEFEIFAVYGKEVDFTVSLNLNCEVAQVATLSGQDVDFRGFLSPYVAPEIWTEVT